MVKYIQTVKVLKINSNLALNYQVQDNKINCKSLKNLTFLHYQEHKLLNIPIYVNQLQNRVIEFLKNFLLQYINIRLIISNTIR